MFTAEDMMSVTTEDEMNVIDLNEFYDTYISGHTSEELCLGNAFCMQCFHDWMRGVNDVRSRYTAEDDYLMSDEFLQNCSYVSGLPKDRVRELIFFARDFSFYSDCYKDEYGVRPHL